MREKYICTYIQPVLKACGAHNACKLVHVNVVCVVKPRRRRNARVCAHTKGVPHPHRVALSSGHRRQRAVVVNQSCVHHMTPIINAIHTHKHIYYSIVYIGLS